MTDDSTTGVPGRVPARYGKAIPLAKGQVLKVISETGAQVMDLWAFNAADLGEYQSMEHTRSFNSKVVFNKGDCTLSERRQPMLCLTEDSSPGIHDTLLCACNRQIYEEMGCTDNHRNCSDNMHEALAAIGKSMPFTPGPLNLFMNIPIAGDGTITRVPPATRPGDFVRLRAEMDLIVVISACPQDISVINGTERTPRDVAYVVEG